MLLLIQTNLQTSLERKLQLTAFDNNVREIQQMNLINKPF